MSRNLSYGGGPTPGCVSLTVRTVQFLIALGAVQFGKKAGIEESCLGRVFHLAQFPWEPAVEFL